MKEKKGLCGSRNCLVQDPKICGGCSDVAALNKLTALGVNFQEADIKTIEAEFILVGGGNRVVICDSHITGFTR